MARRNQKLFKDHLKFQAIRGKAPGSKRINKRSLCTTGTARRVPLHDTASRLPVSMSESDVNRS